MRAADFYTTHHIRYPRDASPVGFLSIKVLEFLNGHPWDDIALGYVHGLRPSSIRVTTGEETCDAQCWRVTVYVDERNAITGMRQEVEVWLPDGVDHGADLRERMKAIS